MDSIITEVVKELSNDGVSIKYHYNKAIDTHIFHILYRGCLKGVGISNAEMKLYPNIKSELLYILIKHIKLIKQDVGYPILESISK